MIKANKSQVVDLEEQINNKLQPSPKATLSNHQSNLTVESGNKTPVEDQEN